MGKRGPRPLPTAVLEARGSRRARQDKNEPQPPAGKGVCPDWIEPAAKEVWAQMVPILDAMGVLTIADTNALTRYCQMFARWKKAEQFIQQFGETYPVKSGTGVVKCFFQWPQVNLAQKLSTALTKLEQEFGLTPSARSRIDVKTPFLPEPELTEFEKEFPVRNWAAGEPPTGP